MLAHPDEFDTPHDFEHATKMIPALEAGSVEVVREIFGRLGAPSPEKATAYLNEILDLDSFAVMSAHARAENTLSRPIMAKDEASFEKGLAAIVGIIAPHTDMMSSIMPGREPAQNAFDLYEKPHRLPAALAIMQQTLQQNPAWKPNISGIFAEIGYEPGERKEDVDAYRATKAEGVNLLGAATSAWLKTTAADVLKLRFSVVDQAYWGQQQWQTDPAKMPWAHGTQVANKNRDFVTSLALAAGWDAPGHKKEFLEGLRAREKGNALLARLSGKVGKNNLD